MNAQIKKVVSDFTRGKNKICGGDIKDVRVIGFIFKGLKAINVKNVIASEGTGQNI